MSSIPGSRPSYVFFLAAIACLLFIPFLGNAHLFDWDEINFAECAREMLVTGDYSRVYVDFKPFWEKPPLFFWMQSLAMWLFGVNEFAARFPNAVCGIVTLIVLYNIGKKIYDSRFGMYWSMAYAGSVFPHLYFKSGIIDPWFNLFIFVSLYYFILYHWKRNAMGKEGLRSSQLSYVVWSGLFMGLAILMKGQVALMIFLLTAGVYLLYNRFRFYFHWGHALLFLLVSLLVTSTWYAYETLKNGPWFITEFLRYQYRLFSTHDAGHKGFPGYHFVVILLGCFPASAFAIPSFFKTPYSGRHDRDFKMWMIILFWVVTILFTIVQSRIIHYSSLAWFPVCFLGAYSFYKWEQKAMNYKRYAGVIAAIIGGIISLALIAIPLVAMNIRKLIPYVKDKFARGNMEADVVWTGWESLAGVLLLLSLVMGLSYLRRRDFQQAAWVLFAGTALTVFLASAMIVPRVEQYSQGAAIEFFKQRRGEDCYVRPLGYKSYAHLFYTQKKKPANENYYDLDWLLKGPIDKPAYFICKIHKVGDYAPYTDIKELYRKNGFVFMKREVPGR